MNRVILIPAVLAAFAIAGCASAPSPAAAIAAGSSSLEGARASGAGELATLDINRANDKLERSRALALAGDKRGAARLAEEADLDAQLARARAGSERSRQAAAQLEAGLQTLRDELARKAVTQPVRMPQ